MLGRGPTKLGIAAVAVMLKSGELGMTAAVPVMLESAELETTASCGHGTGVRRARGDGRHGCGEEAGES